MKLKRLLALFLAGAMSAAMLTGCGGDSSKDSGSGSSTPDASNAGSNTTGTDPDTSGTGTESDMEYVKGKGTLIVGITDFAPMDYREKGSEEWIGFDADMAKAFAESLGVKAEFIEINWDNKIMELDSKGIDAAWNGMTLTDEVVNGMNCSVPYCLNAQVVVVPSASAEQYKDIDSLKEASIAVESGSAGQAVAESLGLNFTAVQTQANALMEVASGASQGCVIDLLMAGAMIGEGTSYPDLVYTVNLNEANGDDKEEYGVGFRKESDLTAAFNDFYKTAYEDGTVEKLAATYGIQESILAPQ